ncbi:P-loop containing nucleoside triphosphate hydrolase protein [Hypoxylon sp. FL0890]|nr:P-loop containing nucleoside triphosphate hydrolase protein [Hypoxylon sp. FL0890]
MDIHELSELRPSDVIILVMGITGSGKSSFISELLQEDVDIIGHNLTSHTSRVSFFMLKHEDGRRVFLMDTPGFDDTYRSNAEVLRDIAFVLAKVYQCGINVAGIIYMHRITDNRVSGSSAKNLEILRRLCGPNAFPRIVLTSSMWDSTVQDPALLQEAFNHENQLKRTENFWGSLHRGGSHIMRWMGDRESALGVIRYLMDLYDARGNAILKIQKELVDEARSLDDTDVGKIVQDGFVQALEKHREELEDLSSELSQALREGDKIMASELRETIDATEHQLENLESSHSAIKTSLEHLSEDKTREYQELHTQIQEDLRLMTESMKQYQEDCRRLVEEQKTNIEALRQAQAESELQRLSLAGTLSESPGTDTKGASKLNKPDRELHGQFEEEQIELTGRKRDRDKKMRRKHRWLLLKKNSLPMLSILAGIGATVGGGITINPALILAGFGLVASGVSKLNFNRHTKRRERQDELFSRDAMIGIAST